MDGHATLAQKGEELRWNFKTSGLERTLYQANALSRESAKKDEGGFLPKFAPEDGTRSGFVNRSFNLPPAFPAFER